MCEHVSKIQTGRVIADRNRVYQENAQIHNAFVFTLSCDDAERERQLRILDAAVLQIQDYVPGLYDGLNAPDNTNVSDADKYIEAREIIEHVAQVADIDMTPDRPHPLSNAAKRNITQQVCKHCNQDIFMYATAEQKFGEPIQYEWRARGHIDEQFLRVCPVWHDDSNHEPKEWTVNGPDPAILQEYMDKNTGRDPLGGQF